MKIAMIADTHAGVRNDHPAVLENFKRSCKFFFDECHARGIKDIVHLGDLYDRSKYVNFFTAHMVRTAFLNPANEFRTHIILGNHDQFYKETYDVNALRELIGDRYSNISIYSVPTEVVVGGLPVLLLPWISKANKELTRNAIATSKASVAMGHLELNGYKMYANTIEMDHGDDPQEFKGFKKVFTGHFHERSSKDNIYYIGAMGEYTWADYGCYRGFAILDTVTLDVEYVENPHKLYTSWNYNDANDPDMTLKVQNMDYSGFKDKYVRVVVEARNNAFAFENFLDRLYEADPCDVKIVDSIDAIIDNEEDVLIDEAQDTPTILDGYISGLTLPVDTKRMQKYMRERYKEAIEMEHVE